MRIMNGTLEEQFQKLWDYRTELLKRNPNSTVEIDIEPGIVSNYFTLKCFMCTFFFKFQICACRGCWSL